MGHHGWGGDPPATEELARARILEATHRCLERSGVAKTTFSDVAAEVGVTRQTVYRYFPSLGDLLNAVAASGTHAFVERMRQHLATYPTPLAAVVEAIVFCVEELPREPRIGLLLQAEDDLFGRGVTSPAGVGLAAQFLRSLAVDWASVDVTDEDLDGLAELMLRLIGSLMQYPASTPRSPDDVRAYVRRWLGPALTTASTRT